MYLFDRSDEPMWIQHQARDWDLPMWIGGAFAGIAFLLVVLRGVVSATAWTRARKRFARSGLSKKQWRRVQRGAGRDIEELADWLPSTPKTLREFRPRYRRADIPKRSGGPRHLLIPDDATKALQRTVLRRVLRGLRAHPAACGFERGKSTIDNALPHIGQGVVIKLDIVDFFTATLAPRVEWYFRVVGWDAEAALALTTITTAEGGLAQGAPTSPRLSNLLNFYFDVQLATEVTRRGGIYTRYADDLTISFAEDNPKRNRGTIQYVRRLLKSKGYRLNTKKTRILRQSQRQIVTGLVVNERLNVPRATRRQLRAVSHRLANGKDATMTKEQVAGWQAYLAAIARRREISDDPLRRPI